MSGLAFNRSIVRQRSRHAASIASPAQPSQSIRAVLNVRPYSAKYAPSQREPTAFASEAYHEREISGKPFRVDRYLRDPSPATTETPVDLTPEQRKIIERTLRVDLVGEGGANWIYQATKFVADLKGDKETSKKVEASRFHLPFEFSLPAGIVRKCGQPSAIIFARFRLCRNSIESARRYSILCGKLLRLPSEQQQP